MADNGSKVPRSFISYPAESHFSLQNLPYGVFSTPNGSARVGVAIGDQILDLALLESEGWLKSAGILPGANIFGRESLNPFMKLGKPVWDRLRDRVTDLLREESNELRGNEGMRKAAFSPMAEAKMLMPVDIGDYTDFYSSRHHAYNVGVMMRGPENALQPNWTHLPVGYHGRASSVVVSGAPVVRPSGQIKEANAETPIFSPSRSLDYELEMGFFVGKSSEMGSSIDAAQADDYIFGMVIVNDWSARDIQAWEYVPLGPFLSKNFCTSISPWVVPMAALAPFRRENTIQDPQPLPYLRCSSKWNFDIQLEVSITTREGEEMVVCRSNFSHLYWNICQQLLHHTVNGCPVRVGDLMATGTISGPTESSLGCLLESTLRGKRPLTFPSGATRTFLLDGDKVKMTGFCQGQGFNVGFGSVEGVVKPAART